jgi:radical SAM superfamily enzyme YgiQ (UPF0313 family)
VTDEALPRHPGTRRPLPLAGARFPDADALARERAAARAAASRVDVLLANPPAPDGGVWIRSQHRVGRRSRENMLWPQVSLAQLAALLLPDYTVEVVDAIALRLDWPAYERLLRERRPRYYLTQVTAPTLTNDMYGVFLARSLGATTLAFGTHVTPLARETLRAFPALDFVLRGEPEITLRELVDLLEAARGRWRVGPDGGLRHPADGREPAGQALLWRLARGADPAWAPPWAAGGAGEAGEARGDGAAPGQEAGEADERALARVAGLGWRRAGRVTLNADRPFIRDLDDLPLPAHHLLPVSRYRMPMIRGPYAFVVTSRGCPAGCTYCIKHVTYQNAVRLRSPERLVEEIRLLRDLGVRHVHMYADLFTVSRDQVVGLCRRLVEDGTGVTWTCNSRVDYVDPEMLRLMARAGCTLVAWGIESGNELVLRRAHKGYRLEQAHRALGWARAAGLRNWGYFIIGLPGETVATIRETIEFAKALPLDIALFHVAAPYPGTPFFFDVVRNGWFRPGTDWESVDMDRATVLDYPGLSAEDLLAWQRRAFREWALRPGPLWTFARSLNSWAGLASALSIARQTLGWLAR